MLGILLIMDKQNILNKIEPPQFNERNISNLGFIGFLSDYYIIEEMEKAGKNSRLNDLVEPVFQHYRLQNLGNAQKALTEAGKQFMDESDLGTISASNRFLSYFAQKHLSQKLNPQYLLDSDFIKAHPNGIYIQGGTYLLLTKDRRFFISNFTKEARSWMSEFMDLYQEGFSKELE